MKYTCPMKCNNGKIYDKPGKCPICGMNLVPAEAQSSSGSHEHHDHHHE